MWKWITAEDSIGEYPNPYLLLKQSVKEAFDNEWDVFPPGRFRAIHSAGAICRFQIDVAEDSHYTGLTHQPFLSNQKKFRRELTL